MNEERMEQTAKPHIKYDFKTIERTWQERWKETDLYRAPEFSRGGDKKFYMLVMFPYPSGDIHMGHFRNYVIADAVARYQMMLGKDVLHPFGWDAFGLPAENAAIKHGVHPAEWTIKNIGVSRTTIQQVGISYDWSREVNSSSPDYYKWTQWMFLQLFKRGLAVRKRGFVNWCPKDKTVLANEQVKDGHCDRCGTLVEKKDQIQWYFKITEYADRLTDDLDKLPGWPENVKAMQRAWIGRSYGAEIDFVIEGTNEKLPIFTTRPDTVFGVTFMAISPESEIIERLQMDAEHAAKVKAYRAEALRRSEIDRAAVNTDKDGVFTGKYAINPLNGDRVQLWVADYVLGGYGTGVVMGVPAHDTRDFAFAKKYDVPIKVVIQKQDGSPAKPDEPYTEYGPMVNSGEFGGLAGEKAITKVTESVASKGIGRKKVNYKLKDWLISRQRFWGCPIPIIHCKACGEVPVPDTDLPVHLPNVMNFMPQGRSPLADVPEYMNVKCPKCGEPAERDPDTMDTFVCSSWYFLRYIDPNNDKMPFEPAKANNWMPIDLYIGGITHATGHLLYFRFFTKVLHDMGLLQVDEPDTQLFNHGMVMDASGQVMSKSKGNVVSPIGIMDQRGIDVARLAMFFSAPSDRELLWTGDAVTGVEKFVMNRLYPMVKQYRGTKAEPNKQFNRDAMTDYERKIHSRLHKTISVVTDGCRRIQFNTPIAALMELEAEYDSSKITDNELNDSIIRTAIQLIAPLAPHLAEQMWSEIGGSFSVFKSWWPEADPEAAVGDTIEVAVQVNGKLRETLQVPPNVTQAEVEKAAYGSTKVTAFTEGKEVIKVIYVSGRILNIVVK